MKFTDNIIKKVNDKFTSKKAEEQKEEMLPEDEIELYESLQNTMAKLASNKLSNVNTPEVLDTPIKNGGTAS